MVFSRITGTGSYLPETVVTNQELASRVETSDEWILTRTGIRTRHVAPAHLHTSDLAERAARSAMQSAGITPEQLDFIIVATSTPDMIFPSTACILHDKLKAKPCPAFDVQAVCAGFVYALHLADCLMHSPGMHHGLVIGADTFSRILDWKDRNTCVLFGDGAGAVVLTRSDQPGICASRINSNGRHASILQTPGHVRNGRIQGDPFLRMNGKAVFRQAVDALSEVGGEVLSQCQMKPGDIDWLIPHQANLRIMQAVADRIGVPQERLVSTVEQHANTSAASIPLALDTAVKDGRIQPNQNVMLAGVGGGMTWGASLVRM